VAQGRIRLAGSVEHGTKHGITRGGVRIRHFGRHAARMRRDAHIVNTTSDQSMRSASRTRAREPCVAGRYSTTRTRMCLMTRTRPDRGRSDPSSGPSKNFKSWMERMSALVCGSRPGERSRSGSSGQSGRLRVRVVRTAREQEIRPFPRLCCFRVPSFEPRRAGAITLTGDRYLATESL
jgi:hypothetical protein